MPRSRLIQTAVLASTVFASLVSTAAFAQPEVGPLVNPANGNRYTRLGLMGRIAARAAATGMGGHLVTINDAAENEWVRANVAAAGGNTARCFIGLSDEAVEGTFAWMSGQALVYTNWGPGEPTNSGGDEDIVEMVPFSGIWNDIPTGSARRAIVEVSGPIRVPAEFPTIQAAIAAAVDGQTILVSPGTYAGTVDFQFKRLVVRSTDGPSATTILAPPGTYGLILAGGQGTETICDGFHLRGQGFPGGPPIIALYDSQVLRNCVISSSPPQVGMLLGGSGVVDGCIFAGLVSDGIQVYPLTRNCTPTIQNCTLVGNSAGVTLANNRPETVVRITNSIFSDNSVPLQITGQGVLTISHCNFSDPQPGEANTVGDPRFVSAPGPDNVWDSADDYRLLPGSPCIDAGSNAARVATPVAALPLDIYGATRFSDDPNRPDTGNGPGAVIDIGAAEFQGSSSGCERDFNHDGFIDPDDLADFITAFFLGC